MKIVFDHEFDPDDSTQESVCGLCGEKLRNSAIRCPFRRSLHLELEEETLP